MQSQAYAPDSAPDSAAIDYVRRIPPLPRACRRVIAISRDPGASGRKLAAAIGSDPRMAMKVMGYANSAALARRSPAQTVAEAVMRIGFEEARRLALGAAMLSTFGARTSLLDLDDVFNQGVEVSRAWGAEGEVAGVAGVLQHVGLLAMTVDSQRFRNYVLQVARTRDYEDLHCLEQQLYGVTRCDLTALAAVAWRLPRPIIDVLSQWHVCRPGDLTLYVAAHACAEASPSPLLRWLGIR